MTTEVKEIREDLNKIQAISNYGSTEHLLCIIANILLSMLGKPDKEDE